MKVKFNISNEKFKPTKGSEQAAGIDLFCSKKTIVPGSGGRAWVPTGVKTAIPKGYFGMIADRSGWSYDNETKIGAGIIDSDFRGEIRVLVWNFSPAPLTINVGIKFAQMIILPHMDVEIIAGTDMNLDETTRGDQGFGSSDKKEEK
jgi:dUTP pyrophosphatase